MKVCWLLVLSLVSILVEYAVSNDILKAIKKSSSDKKKRFIPGVDMGSNGCTSFGCPGNSANGMYPQDDQGNQHQQEQEQEEEEHYCEQPWYKVHDDDCKIYWMNKEANGEADDDEYDEYWRRKRMMLKRLAKRQFH